MTYAVVRDYAEKTSLRHTLDPTPFTIEIDFEQEGKGERFVEADLLRLDAAQSTPASNATTSSQGNNAPT